MKQDLKHIVNNEKEVGKVLPRNHREEFLMKLELQNKKTSGRFKFLRIASLILIFIAIGVVTLVPNSNMETEEPLLLQLKEVENEYLRQIDAEWDQFVALSADKRLKQRFELKLNELQDDYWSLTTDFQNDPNNLMILESLINNLQTRLQLLKDIQKHINLLNQKNEQDENSL